MKKILGLEVYDSIKTIPVFNYFKFQKLYSIFIGSDIVSFNDSQEITEHILSLAQSGNIQELQTYLSNKNLAHWKNVNVSSDLCVAFGFLVKTELKEPSELYEMVSLSNLNYEVILNECKLLNDRFDSEIEKHFPELMNQESIHQIHDLQKKWLKVSIDSYDEIEKIKNEFYKEMNSPSFHPSAKDNFMDKYDENISKWYNSLELNQKELHDITYFDFLIKSQLSQTKQ